MKSKTSVTKRTLAIFLRAPIIPKMTVIINKLPTTISKILVENRLNIPKLNSILIYRSNNKTP